MTATAPRNRHRRTDRDGGVPPTAPPPPSRPLLGPHLAAVLEQPGVYAVLLAGSRDPNAKVTLMLRDRNGPDLVVKAPTTAGAVEVVRREGQLLASLHEASLGPLAGTLPALVGYLPVSGWPALITTALPGTPMAVRYHGWRHTARPKAVRADFAAAGAWLSDLQTATAARPTRVTLLDEALDAIEERFPIQAPELRRSLTGAAQRLAACATPRTVVHGDYWFGNLLVEHHRIAGVVDWEAGSLSGEPLRDVVRFAVSYALYLDRHVRVGRQVPGHPGLIASRWGAGLIHLASGSGWFSDLVRDYLATALGRLGLPTQAWHDLLLAGIADVAATADHPDFAADHLRVLLALTREQPFVGEPTA